MIVFDLRCRKDGGTFEAWFASGPDYEDQQERGLVACPLCGSTDIAKAPMAPAVPRKQSQPPLHRLQERLLEGSRWVGDDFAEAARAIHEGEVEPEKLHGRATLADARALAEDGVPVLPLPLPVVPPGEVN